MAYIAARDGTQLYYRDEGNGRPIVMAHGWKASSDVYSQIIERLSPDYRCIAYDQRGHLRSSVPANPPVMQTLAEDLNEIICKLCPNEKPMLIGWSMGGATVLEYIRRFGCANIDRILIVDFPPKMLSDDTWSLGRLNGSYDEKLLNEDISEMNRNFRAFLADYYARTNPSYLALPFDEQQKMIITRMKGHDPAVLTSLWESLCRSDYREVLPRITVPAAVFHAGILPSCSQGAAEYYRQHIPGEIKTVLFENASHALMSEYPDRFCAELRKLYAARP